MSAVETRSVARVARENVARGAHSILKCEIADAARGLEIIDVYFAQQIRTSLRVTDSRSARSLCLLFTYIK